MEPTASADSSVTPPLADPPAERATRPGRAVRLVELAQLAADQRRVVTRRQLHELGWSHQQIDHEIDTGRWTRVAPGVVALQNAPLVHEQRLWLGVLHANGVLSHATACQAHGLERWECSTIDVLTKKGDLVTGLDGFRFHQTRRDFAPWVHPTRRPWTLTIEAAALLAAERDQYLRRGIGRLAAVVQQRLSTAERLLVASLTISKLRNGRVLRLALGAISGGAQSFAELDLGRICAAFGLQPPHRQRIRKDRNGRRRYLDCEWDLPDGRILVLEIDGSFHLEIENWSQDMKRERAVVLSGRTVLRCSSVEIRLSPLEIIQDLRRAGVPRFFGLVA